jgi:ubiquinone/menaquinone biosynthesis C-methylase UbiE
MAALEILNETPSSIVNGIPVFLKPGDVTGNNQKYQQFYDRVGRFTGSVFWFLCRLFRLDLVSKRKDLLSDLPIKPGDRVLETSIGAGANIPALNPKASYFGVDISMGMLQACQKYSLIKPYDLQLFQANAEYLPFQDNSFDVVFHFGGINFFNDIPRAIHEMIRVAKPGAFILIGDEMQTHVDSWYKKMPFIRGYFKDAKPVVIPKEFIPKNMHNIKLAHKWNSSMYIITFNKQYYN